MKRFIHFLFLLIIVNLLSFNLFAKDVTLRFAIWDPNQKPGMEAIARAFEKANPGIKINVEVSGWNDYWTKMDAGAKADAMPDIFWMHVAYFQKFAQNKKLMPISPRMAKDKSVSYSNFPEGLVKNFEWDKVNYGIPKDFDTIALWYNKKIFDDAKLPYPDDKWDWNKLLEVAKKLTNKEKGIYGYVARNSDQEGYWNFIYQNGGYVVSPDKKPSGYDKPESIEALQWYANLILKEGVSPTIDEQSTTNEVNMFESGKIAMITMGSWMTAQELANEYTKVNCDLAVLPKSPKGNRATIFNGLSYSIAAKTKYPEEAWKFVKFCATKEANLIQSNYGSAIPAFNGTQQPWIDHFKKVANFNLKAYVDELSYSVNYPNSKTREKWGQVTNEYIRKILTGKIDVKQGCTEMGKAMTEILKAEK